LTDVDISIGTKRTPW